MSPSIFLTLLCLGIASAAPTTDHSAEAQANQWVAVPGIVLDTVKDAINNVGVEESPVLEKDNQEPIEEQKDFRAACGDINLRLKIPKGIFNKIKGVTRKATLGKVIKGLGKHILGEIVRPDNLLDIATIVGNHILGESNQQEPLAQENNEVSNMTIEEFQAGDVWIPEPGAQTGKSVDTELPWSVDSGEEGHGLP